MKAAGPLHDTKPGVDVLFGETSQGAVSLCTACQATLIECGLWSFAILFGFRFWPLRLIRVQTRNASNLLPWQRFLVVPPFCAKMCRCREHARKELGAF